MNAKKRYRFSILKMDFSAKRAMKKMWNGVFVLHCTNVIDSNCQLLKWLDFDLVSKWNTCDVVLKSKHKCSWSLNVTWSSNNVHRRYCTQPFAYRPHVWQVFRRIRIALREKRRGFCHNFYVIARCCWNKMSPDE